MSNLMTVKNNGVSVTGYYAKVKDLITEEEVQVIIPEDAQLVPNEGISIFEIIDRNTLEEEKSSSIENMTSSEIFTALSETQKDELYRMLWSDHVYEDVKARLSENPDLALDEEEEEALCEDIVNAYVYNGDYDCNLSYWDNIDNLIQECGGK